MGAVSISVGTFASGEEAVGQLFRLEVIVQVVHIGNISNRCALIFIILQTGNDYKEHLNRGFLAEIKIIRAHI